MIYRPELDILYIDMDGVVANFEKAIKLHVPEWDSLSEMKKGEKTDEVCGSIPGFFLNLETIEGAVESVLRLSNFYDTYFLSAPMWHVPQSYTEKRLWIEKHFGESFRKRLILTHRKDLNFGRFLIDDRTSHGAGKFVGKHIHFGSNEFPDWNSILDYLICFEIKFPEKPNPDFLIH